MSQADKKHINYGTQVSIDGSQHVSIGNITNSVEIEGLSGETVEELFQKAVALARLQPQSTKLEELLNLLRHEIQKGNEANTSFIEKALNTLKEIAPDIWEVIVDTLSNPVKGLSTVVLKIMQKAQQET